MYCSLSELLQRDQITANIDSHLSTASLLNSDPKTYSHDFSQFLFFCTHSDLSKELTPILYPLFLHLSIYLHSSNHSTLLREFYCLHSNLFTHKQLESLSQLTDTNCTELPTNLIVYTKHKYAVKLSTPAYSHLLTFLTDNPASAIQLPLQANIQMEVGVRGETEELKKPAKKSSASKPRSSASPSKRVSSSNPSLDALKSCVSQLSSLPPTPSLLHLSISPSQSPPHTATLSFSRSFLLSGHEDGSLQLAPFSLPTSPHSPPTLFNRCTQVPLSFPSSREVTPVSATGELRGHSAPVFSVSVSPSGAWAVSGAGDGTCRLWSLDSTESRSSSVAEYVGHQSPVWSVCLPRQLESGHFASASQDGTVRLWTGELLYPLRIFSGHYSGVNCVDLHLNCVYLASGGQDGTCRLWNSQDGNCVRLLTCGRSAVACLSFSPDGKLVATGSEDGTLRVWNIAESKIVRELAHGEGGVTQLDFAPDSNCLASISQDQTLRLWDLSVPQVNSPYLHVSTGRNRPLSCAFRKVNLCTLISVDN